MSLQGRISIERMCQLAQVSRAGFYRSLHKREPVTGKMEVRAAIQANRIGASAPLRISTGDGGAGTSGNESQSQTSRRLMREDNLLGLQKRAFKVTTNSAHQLEVYLNLARRMKLTGINQLWVADITYIRLKTEFVYLAVILDRFSRKVVGWALERTMTTRLTRSALEKAITDRQPPPGLVHHSDRGLQYAAHEYVEVLRQHQMIPSMSRPANPYDNASCESFMKTLKREEIYVNDYQDLEHLRTNIEEFLEQYYNRQPPALGAWLSSHQRNLSRD